MYHFNRGEGEMRERCGGRWGGGEGKLGELGEGEMWGEVGGR